MKFQNQNDQSSHTLYTYALHVKSFKISQEWLSVSVQSKSMYVVCKTEKKKKNPKRQQYWKENASGLTLRYPNEFVLLLFFLLLLFSFFFHSSTVRKFYNLELKRMRGTLNSNTMDQLSPARRNVCPCSSSQDRK